MFVKFTEVRGDLRTEDIEVWVNAMGVNAARAHRTDTLVELAMDNGDRILVRGSLSDVMGPLDEAVR